MKEKKVSKPSDFYVDIRKFAIFTIISFGLYYIYWFYRSWKIVNILGGKKHRPLLLTLGLAVPLLNLYLISLLFEEIKQIAVERNYKLSFSPFFSMFMFLILQGLWKLPNYYTYIGALSFLPLVPVQLAINGSITDEKSEKMTFSMKEILFLIIFGFIFILSLFYRS